MVEGDDDQDLELVYRRYEVKLENFKMKQSYLLIEKDGGSSLAQD